MIIIIIRYFITTDQKAEAGTSDGVGLHISTFEALKKVCAEALHSIREFGIDILVFGEALERTAVCTILQTLENFILRDTTLVAFTDMCDSGLIDTLCTMAQMRPNSGTAENRMLHPRVMGRVLGCMRVLLEVNAKVEYARKWRSALNLKLIYSIFYSHTHTLPILFVHSFFKW